MGQGGCGQSPAPLLAGLWGCTPTRQSPHVSVRAVSAALSLQTEHLCPTRDMLRAGVSLWPLATGSTDPAHITHPQPGLGGL